MSILLLTACQSDDFFVQNDGNSNNTLDSTTIITKVSAVDIPEIISYLNSSSSNNGKFEIKSIADNTNNKATEPDLVIGELQTDEIIAVIKNSHRKNYTFKLKSIESNPDNSYAFFNLVAEENTGNYFVYIMEYRPTDSWINNYSKKDHFTSFSGTIIYYKTSGEYVGKISMIDGSTTNIENRNPCDTDINNDGGGGGGSTSGNGDGGGGDGANGDITAGGDYDCTWFITGANCNNINDQCTTTIHLDCGGLKFRNSNIGKVLRTPCNNTLDECYQDNTDPCPYGCNASGDGCADGDQDPPVGIFPDIRPSCEKLNELLSNDEFNEALSNIQEGADGNSERGFEISKDQDGNIDTNFVQGGFDSTPLQTGDDVIGTMHNHTEDFGYPLFSADDIFVLGRTFLENSNRAPNGTVIPGDVFSVMVSQNGTFGMTINNFFTLSSLTNNISLDKLNRKLNSAYNRSDSPNDYLENMLKTINKLLEKYDIEGEKPLSLYKLNQDGDAFEEITLDENGNLNPPQPCN